MKTKVSAAVWLLVQTNPHVTEVLLETTQETRDELTNREMMDVILKLQRGSDISGCFLVLTGEALHLSFIVVD